MSSEKMVVGVPVSKYKRRYRRKTYLKKYRFNGAKMRAQGRSVNVRWFKAVEPVPSNTNGEIFGVWRPRDLTTGTNILTATFEKYASFWSMYRCTRIVVKLFPVGIGSESLQGAAGQDLFKRGDVVTWVNQDDSAQAPPPPGGINSVIGKESARLRQGRSRFKIWCNRPSKQFPIWGDIDGTFNNPIFQFVDPWNCSVVVYGDNFSPSTRPGEQVFYWAFIYYRCEFKGQKH